MGALVLVGDARDPFTALDDRFLVALGQQVGAALENTDLYRRLEARTLELASLSARMIEQHEEERRRLSRELHDETGQVFSAVRRSSSGCCGTACRRHRALAWTRCSGSSTRGSAAYATSPTTCGHPSWTTSDSCPRSDRWSRSSASGAACASELDAPATLPPLSEEAELALFRALQEALSNVLRHAQARSVDIGISVSREGVLLEVRDDGRGPDGARPKSWSAGATWDSRGCGSGSARSGAPYDSGVSPVRVRCSRCGSRRRPALVTETPIRVLVADDHAIVRTGIRHVLESEPGFVVVGEASTGTEALELAATLRPDVAVLDISMPGTSGLRVAAELGSVRPRPRCSSSACTTTPSTCWRASGRASTATCSRIRRPPSCAAPSGRCGAASPSSARPSRAG